MAVEWLSNSFSLKEEEIVPVRRKKKNGREWLGGSLPALVEGDADSSICPVQQVKEWRRADIFMSNQETEEDGEEIRNSLVEIENEQLHAELSRTREELERVKHEKDEMSRALAEMEKAKDDALRVAEESKLEKLVKDSFLRDSRLDELTAALNESTEELNEMRAHLLEKEEEAAHLEGLVVVSEEKQLEAEKEKALVEEELRELLASRRNDGLDNVSMTDSTKEQMDKEAVANGFDAKPERGLRDDGQEGIELNLERVTTIQMHAARSIARLYSLVKQLRKEETRERHGKNRKKEELRRVLALAEKAVLVQEELEVSLQLIEMRLTRRFEEGKGGANYTKTKEIDPTVSASASLEKIEDIEKEALKALEETKQTISNDIHALKNDIKDMKTEIRMKHEIKDSFAAGSDQQTEEAMRRLQMDLHRVVESSSDKDEAIQKITSLIAGCGGCRNVGVMNPSDRHIPLLGCFVECNSEPKERPHHRDNAKTPKVESSFQPRSKSWNNKKTWDIAALDLA